MTDTLNPEDVPQPDPGNSPPENWTEPLSEDEQREAKERLKKEANERATEQGADYVVIDGEVTAVDKSSTTSAVGRGEATVEFIEPAPVEYRTDEQIALDAEPVEANADDGSSSPSN